MYCHFSFRIQTTTLTSRPGTTMIFLTGWPSMGFWTPASASTSSRSPWVGVARHAHVAALLAVDLHHQLDLVLLSAAGSGSGQGAVRMSSPNLQFAPQVVRDVRRDGREQPQQDADSPSCSTDCRCARRRASSAQASLERVQHLHGRGSHRVELVAPDVVIGLLQIPHVFRAARRPAPPASVAPRERIRR